VLKVSMSNHCTSSTDYTGIKLPQIRH